MGSIASQEPDLSLFSEEELEVIHDVAGFFHEYTAAKISEFFHEEKAYVETSLRDIIPFSYAPTIKLDYSPAPLVFHREATPLVFSREVKWVL